MTKAEAHRENRRKIWTDAEDRMEKLAKTIELNPDIEPRVEAICLCLLEVARQLSWIASIIHRDDLELLQLKIKQTKLEIERLNAQSERAENHADAHK